MLTTVLTTLLSHFWLWAYLSLTAWPLQASGITQGCGALPSLLLLLCDSGERREQDGGAALRAPVGGSWLLPCPAWSHPRAAPEQLLPWQSWATTCLAEGSPGLSPRTVAVLLGRVGDQPAVVWSRRHQVWDAVVVIIVVTLVTNPILISVQLGAVNDRGAVVCTVLVPVSITVGERRGGLRPSSAEDTKSPVLRRESLGSGS